MKTTKMQIEYDVDFQLIGVISALKDYKMAWIINKETRLNFARAKDLELEFVNKSSMKLVNYFYETKCTYFRLIKNKSIEITNIASPFLIPEMKDYDFFIQVCDESGVYEVSELIQQLRNISGIEFVTAVNIEQLKSKDNLIF